MNYYAVGDIHGMLDAFRRILMDIDADMPNQPRPCGAKLWIETDAELELT